MIRIKFVQVPEQKTLFEYDMRDVIFPSATSIHQKSRVLDLSVYTLFPLHWMSKTDQNKKQLKKAMILNT